MRTGMCGGRVKKYLLKVASGAISGARYGLCAQAASKQGEKTLLRKFDWNSGSRLKRSREVEASSLLPGNELSRSCSLSMAGLGDPH
jgi:hypothetical protein